MEELERLLELVRRELGADDARLELGGKPPDDDAIWCVLPNQFRLVAVFDEAPRESVPSLREKLVFLARSFDATLDQVSAPEPRRNFNPQDALDDALDVLATQAHALAALVIDNDSPVFWGTSLFPRGEEEVSDTENAAAALDEADEAGIDLPSVLAGATETELSPSLDRWVARAREHAGEPIEDPVEWNRRLRAFASIAALRKSIGGGQVDNRRAVHDAALAYLARSFGGIYWLVLSFDRSAFSELHAEAAMIHALPWIERLVTSLPPIDPDGGGGRVLKLRRLRPV